MGSAFLLTKNSFVFNFIFMNFPKYPCRNVHLSIAYVSMSETAGLEDVHMLNSRR